MSIKAFDSAAEFREWLEKNHATANELWLVFYNQRSKKKGISYREALDEALCFGWIDGVRKSINQTTYKQRFTPRKARSYWSAINIKRAEELRTLRRMTPAGLEAFERRSSDSGKYCFESRPKELPGDYEKQFQANQRAWKFFRTQPPSYQRTAIFWIVSAKQEETRQRRLATVISDSAAGRRLGMLAPKKPASGARLKK